MTALNLPSLSVLAMHKSNGDAHPKLWESLSGKKPLLLQSLASPCKLPCSSDSRQSTCLCKVTAAPLSLQRTARVRDTALHIPLRLGPQQLHTELLAVRGQQPATQPPGGSR